MAEKIKNKNWILDIPATENWLNDMQLHGNRLVGVNFRRGIFTFDDSPVETSFHKIAYGSGREVESYAAAGYEFVASDGDYYVLKTIESSPRILPSLSRLQEEVIDDYFRLRIPLIIFSVLLGIVFLIIVPFLIDTGIKEGIQIGNIVVSATFLCLFSIPVIIYACKYHRCKIIKKSLAMLFGDANDLVFATPRSRILSKEEVKKLKEEKRYIKKSKSTWRFAPDIAEAWLEDMEAKGYNLVRLGAFGKFIFIKGEPRKVKYAIDFQAKTNPEYFNLIRDNDWTLCYSYPEKRNTVSIWSKQYEDEPPAFYSDKESKINHAKYAKNASFMPALPLFTLLGVLMNTTVSMIKAETRSIGMVIAYTVICVLFVACACIVIALIIKTRRYYKRIKNSIPPEEA